MIQQTDFGIMMGWRREADETHHQWRINLWMLPGYALIANGVAGSTVGCNIRVPMDDKNSWFFRVRWNADRPLTDQEQQAFRSGGFIYPELIPGTFMTRENRGNDYLIDRELQKTATVAGIKSVTQQDRAMTDSMGPIYDRTKEHLGTSDAVIIAMRRRMLQLVRALFRAGRRAVCGGPSRHLPATAYRRAAGAGCALGRALPATYGGRWHRRVGGCQERA